MAQHPMPMSSAPQPVSTLSEPMHPKGGALVAFAHHWPEYLMEAAGLSIFMVSACVFGTAYELPTSPVRKAIDSDFIRRLLMGITMGLTAIGIFHSPWGKRSGAHINPAVSLTFFRLGKIKGWDALFYSVFQFAGGLAGVLLAALFLREALADPHVRYVVTVPGGEGATVAAIAEIAMSFGMMAMVLYTSNHPKLKHFTTYFAGILIATYITLLAPMSGFSINPARTFGSALLANVWDSIWIYFLIPPIGMLAAAEAFRWHRSRHAVQCAKLHHHNDQRCIFCGANGGSIL
jgi:aquaporin Z